MMDETLRTARILIVDDQDANVCLLQDLLTFEGYECIRGITDPRDVEGVYVDFQPDLILLDLMMPHLDGFQVMERLRVLIPGGAYLPVLVLTADVTPEARQRALASGAKDFLVKPFDPVEVSLRIRNLLVTRHLHLQLQAQNWMLEQRVRERTQQLEEAHVEVLDRLAAAAEFRDDDTGQHTRRVGQSAALVARVLGIPDAVAQMTGRAAALHDVGKIGVPDHILRKPGRLTSEEFEIIKSHTTIGAQILSGGRFPLMQCAERIALGHHERWDGRGYPRGLRGDMIPIEARIVSVVDAFDALRHDRPYRAALTDEETWEILGRGAGTQWDAEVVRALAALQTRVRVGRGAVALVRPLVDIPHLDRETTPTSDGGGESQE